MSILPSLHPLGELFLSHGFGWEEGRFSIFHPHSWAVTIWGHNLLLFSPVIKLPFPQPSSPAHLWAPSCPTVLGWEDGREGPPQSPGGKGRTKHSWSPTWGCSQQGGRSCVSLAQVSPRGVAQSTQIHGLCDPLIPELPEDCRGRWESFVEETLTETNRRNTVDLVSWSRRWLPGLPRTEKGDIPSFSHCPCFAEEHFQGGVESISINIP